MFMLHEILLFLNFCVSNVSKSTSGAEAYAVPSPGTMERWMVRGPCPMPEPEQTEPPAIDWGKSYYDILGVSKGARVTTIRAAFKRMAAIYHPDKAGAQFTETFQRLNHIQSILTDKKTRSAYNKDPNSFPFPGDGGEPCGAPSTNDVKIVATCIDYVDVANLEFFASLKAANFIVLQDDDDYICNETLRSRALVELKRLEMAKSLATVESLCLTMKTDAPR